MNIPDLASGIQKRDAAYEIKFVLPSDIAERVLDWARSQLEPDPNANSAKGDGYRVNSLYFDTAQFDVYRRNGSYAKSKYRVRRYGGEENLFLERKLKSRGLVSKRRCRVPDHELTFLSAEELPQAWNGMWFRRRLALRQLQPTCQIRYDRVARLGMTAEGPIRLTVDRNVNGLASAQYAVHESGAWVPLLPDRCILELKFRLGLPPLFKSLLEALTLTPQPMSKYRLAIQAFRLVPDEPTEQSAVSHNGHVAPEVIQSTLPAFTERAPVQPEA